MYQKGLKEVEELLVLTLVATGMISSLSLPDAIAAAARLWDSTCWLLNQYVYDLYRKKWR